MEQTRRRIGTWPRATAALPLVLAFSVSAVRPAMASDGALEPEQLAALARQIELADRLADHLADQAASTASPERARYHFDYARLRADLKRIRAGVQDYLVPQRAQPRDPERNPYGLALDCYANAPQRIEAPPAPATAGKHATPVSPAAPSQGETP